MARTKAPLLSLDASGSIAKAIVYSKWKGRSYVRSSVKPSNPKSGLQVGMRASLKFLTQIYAHIGATAQANWKAAAKKQNITALDQMVKVNQTRQRQNFGMIEDPAFTAGAVEAAPGAPSATAQPKSLALAWTDSAGANDWCTAVFMSVTNGFTPDVSNMIAIVPHGNQKLVVEKLVTGTTYYFQLAGEEHGGTMGTKTAQFTGTPT